MSTNDASNRPGAYGDYDTGDPVGNRISCEHENRAVTARGGCPPDLASHHCGVALQPSESTPSVNSLSVSGSWSYTAASCSDAKRYRYSSSARRISSERVEWRRRAALSTARIRLSGRLTATRLMPASAQPRHATGHTRCHALLTEEMARPSDHSRRSSHGRFGPGHPEVSGTG